MEKVQTVLKYPGPTSENATIREDDKTTWKFEEKWSSGSNILGLIVASLVNTYLDKSTNGRTDRQKNRQMDRQTDRETGIHTDRQIVLTFLKFLKLGFTL